MENLAHDFQFPLFFWGDSEIDELRSYVDKDGSAGNHAERAEQGLGKALPNKYDQSVRLQFQFVKLWPRVDTCFLIFP